MSRRKPHVVQVILNGSRYVATERNGDVDIVRDGDPAGGARWLHDQLVVSTAVLPDDVVVALEKQLKARFDANWDED